MFRIGLSEDMEDTYQARLGLRLATNTIEEVKSIVSNVITDDELGEINSLLGERKESIQDTLLDIEFVDTNG